MNCCPDFGNGKILRQIDSVRNGSMFNTNQKTPFSHIVAAELARSTSADIAVGYCGLSAVQQAKKALLKVASKGRVRLVLGMYRIDGSLTNKLREELCELHRALTAPASISQRLIITAKYGDSGRALLKRFGWARIIFPTRV